MFILLRAKVFTFALRSNIAGLSRPPAFGGLANYIKVLMRISLINPNLSGDISILDIGLTYLATYLNKESAHQAEIIDLTYHRKDWREHIRRHFREFKPDLAGITTVSLYMQYIRMIAREIKSSYKLPVILGGYHCSLMPEESINIPGVDAICIGDGEYALNEYLNAAEDKKTFQGISGIWARVGAGIIRNAPRPLIQDIDNLPVPDYSLWEDIGKFIQLQELLYFIGTRGCPYNCTYCSSYPMKQAIPGQHFRRRDPKGFAREISEQWAKYKGKGMRLAHAFDPVFTFDLKWLEDFSKEYIKLGLAKSLPYSCFSRPDMVDEERAKLLAESGCKLVRLGIETGNERIRGEVYEKHITNARITESIRLCKHYGLSVTGYYMLGGPGESRSTINDTFTFARQLNVERPIFFTYRPLPKTIGREKVVSLGGIIHEEWWDKLDSLHAYSNIENPDLKPGDIVLARRKMIAYFAAKRVCRLVRKQGVWFFINFFRYMFRGLSKGMNIKYLAGYFLVCCGDNLTS